MGLKKSERKYCCGYLMLQISFTATGEHLTGVDGKPYTEKIGIICRVCYKTILDYTICNLVIDQKPKKRAFTWRQRFNEANKEIIQLKEHITKQEEDFLKVINKTTEELKKING